MKIDYVFLSILFFIFCLSALGQTADRPASFPGGNKALENYIKKNLYTTAEAKVAAVKGAVMIKFTINEEGKPESVYIHLSLGYGCDEQVQKMISEMPVWEAGVINGKKIKTRFTKNIFFSDSTPVAKGIQLAERKKAMVYDTIAVDKKTKTPIVVPAKIKKIDIYASIQKYMAKNFKCPTTINKNWEDRLFTRFHINRDGTINDIKIIEGGDDGLNKVVVDLLAGYPPLPAQAESIQPLFMWYNAEIVIRKRKITSITLIP